MSTVRVCDVALDPRNGGSDAVWTYRADARCVVGEAVFVPLGNRTALGFVVAIYDASETDLGFPFSALKSPTGRVEGLGLPAEVVQLATFVAEETLCPLPVALAAASPPGVREKLVTCWSLAEEASDGTSDLFDGTGSEPKLLTPIQREVIRVLRVEGPLIEQKGKPIEPAMVRALKALRTRGIVAQTLRMAPASDRRRPDVMYRLTADEARIEAFLAREGRRKPAQALTLMRLQSAEQGALTAPEIKAMAGVTDSTLKALAEAKLLERVNLDSARAIRTPPLPNDAQRLAIDAVVDSIRTRETRPYLLFGITGSGKTEVYLRAAAEALREGRQVLYLVPEIALAAQAIAQLRERFGRTVAVLHSDLPAGERLANWLKIRNGEASVVLGARSALFAPLSNLGLVIVDEEHEQSYKQESAPRYHAKALARQLGHIHRCPVLLGSATPSVETFLEASQGEEDAAEGTMTLLSLPERAASAQLPTVIIRDLTEGYRVGRPSIFTEELRGRMVATLERGEQTILFLNRRAYAPFLICRDCGNQMGCPNCSVSLSFHRRDRRLRCHHCGYQQAPPEACPKCGLLRIAPFGVGTEKVEEAVAEEFPAARIARLDRDVARRQGALEEILANFRSGEIDILVGTQMVAKGLDFPNVTLVGVIAADVSLNIPDFRSSERTFQLLSQVAGRAGRGSAPGFVVIQTFNPQHPAVVAARTHDFVSIFETLRREREEVGYPPYRRLVNIVLSGENRAAVIAASEEVAIRLQAVPEAEVLGPVDCAIERVLNRWRRHLLVKLPGGSSAAPVGEVLLGFDPKNVQVVVDVDPYTLM